MKLNSKSIKNIAVMLFILLIFLFAGILVLQISIKSSVSVEKNKSQENLRIALSYINMMVKQNDRANAFENFSMNGCEGLLINNYTGEKDLKSAVFYKDGAIYEAIFIDEFDFELAEKINDIDDLDITIEDGLIKIIAKEDGKTLSRQISIRSSNWGVDDE